MSGTNTFTGAVNITGGFITYAGTASSLYPAPLGSGVKNINLTNLGGVRVITAYSNPTSGGVSFIIGSGGGVFDVQNGAGLQLDDAGQFQGTGDLTIQGASTGFVYLNNQAFPFTGSVNLNSALLHLGTNSVLGTTTGRTITVASGASLQIESATLNLPLSLTLNGSGTATVGAALNSITNGDSLSSNINLASTSIISAATATTFTLSGNITGAGGLTTVGGATGSIIVTGAGSYLGNTTINSGILQLGSSGTTGTLPSTGTFTDNGTFAINRTNAVVQGTDFSGAAITGTGGLTQSGTGTTTLTAANTYIALTNVTGGVLRASGAGTFGGGTAPLTIAAAGTVDLNGTSQTIGASTARARSSTIRVWPGPRPSPSMGLAAVSRA